MTSHDITRYLCILVHRLKINTPTPILFLLQQEFILNYKPYPTPFHSLSYHNPTHCTTLPEHSIYQHSTSYYTIPHTGGRSVLSHSMTALRNTWEGTSFALEKRQCDIVCVDQEREGLLTRSGPSYKVNDYSVLDAI